MADDPYARIAELEAELTRRERALAEALARETATGPVTGDGTLVATSVRVTAPARTDR